MKLRLDGLAHRQTIKAPLGVLFCFKTGMRIPAGVRHIAPAMWTRERSDGARRVRAAEATRLESIPGPPQAMTAPFGVLSSTLGLA